MKKPGFVKRFPYQQMGVKFSTLFVLLAVLGLASLSSVLAADTWTVNSALADNSGCVAPTFQCKTIQAAVTAAAAGETIQVKDGTYTENVTIDKNLILTSENGRASTTIAGVSGVGALGAVVVNNNTTGAQIGDTGKGFTIVGIDNGNPGIENAALYFQGNHSNALVKGNDIQANGDHGLLTEFGATISGFVVSGNLFSGKTFTGSQPAGNGFSSQFTLANVPRQLVTMGGGSGGGNTSNITFSDNQITGTAGGTAPEGNEQGNTLVTVDANTATITGNTFQGTTRRFGTSLRARGPNATMSGNTFTSTGLTSTTGHLFVQNNALNAALVNANTFDKGVWVENAAGGSIGLVIQPAITAVPAGTTLNILAGTYAESLAIDKSLTLKGAQNGVAVSGRTAGTATESTIQGLVTINAANVELSGFTVTNPGQGTGILVKSASDTIMIRQNIVNNVGGTGFVNANAQGIYLENGPDNVSILDNRVSNVAATRNTSAGTAKGIYIGDTTATNTSNNVVIQGNVIESISSPANPNRWGAYGIQTNNNAGATNLLIVNNKISNIEGLWAHAIGLERDTPNAIVRANTISNTIDHKNPSDAIAIFFEDNPSSGTVQVGFNSISNTDIGVAIHPKHGPTYPYVVDARNNFWGDDSGPSGGSLDPSTNQAANGTGALVGPSVRFDPWLGAVAEDVESETLTNGASISTPGGELAATYNSGSGGSATVTVAKYSADPSGGSSSGGLIGGGAAYYDLNVVGNTDSSATLSIVLTGGTAGEQLYWYDGTAWKPVRDNSGNSVIADGSGTFTFTLGPNSSPKISELTGTPLASGVSPQMAVQPADYESLIPGDAIAVRIVISATNVAGVEFDLTYDPTFIDIDPSTITLGDFVHADFVGQKSATGGTVQVAFSHIQRAAVSGQGIVAILPFTVKDWNVGTHGSSVTTNLTLSNIILSDETGFSLGTVTAQNDDLDLQRAGNVAGIVNLQGRPNAIGKLDITTVRLEPGENLSDGADMTTGAFDITSVPPRTGSNTYDAIASAPGYLTAVHSGLNVATNATTNLSPVTLLGGDATRDQVINIQDLAFIGARFAKAYGSWAGNDSQADINGDNQINILDLTLAGANFGKSGPRSWP